MAEEFSATPRRGLRRVRIFLARTSYSADLDRAVLARFVVEVASSLDSHRTPQTVPGPTRRSPQALKKRRSGRAPSINCQIEGRAIDLTTTRRLPRYTVTRTRGEEMREDAASSTAYTVLQGVLYTAQSEQYAALVPQSMKRACRIILEASPEGRRRLAQLEHTLFRASVPWLERAIMPGITLHYVLRKLYIRDEVRRAIDAGCTQVVNLGAGFDPMAWELSTEFPDVTFIELDHPATSRQKAHALAAHPVDNLRWLPVDFELTDAHEALSRTESFAANQRQPLESMIA